MNGGSLESNLIIGPKYFRTSWWEEKQRENRRESEKNDRATLRH